MNTDAEISARLLETMTRSGVDWFVLARANSTVDEARSYAYGNTIVFAPWGDEGFYLIAIARGGYAEAQTGRYQSGLWTLHPANDPYHAEVEVIHDVIKVHSR